jgi:hypothetical protein
MKVAIGYRIQSGPWGGGNRFAVSLAEHLRAAGHQVVFELADADIDIILLTDPRPRSSSVSFSSGAILRYLSFTNPRAVVIHRINECDERKGTTVYTGDVEIDQGSLHISASSVTIRESGDAVSEILITVQEFTCNPKTDASLGQVGR